VKTTGARSHHRLKVDVVLTAFAANGKVDKN
jgi:hypothetical protein